MTEEEKPYAYPVWLCSADNSECDEKNDGTLFCYECGNQYDGRTGRLLQEVTDR